MTEAIGPWLSRLLRYLDLFMMTINDKIKRNKGGKCLGWPLTSYDPGNRNYYLMAKKSYTHLPLKGTIRHWRFW